ncbi:MAG TPA: hypothetical protein VLG44_04565 [Chlamydiales bacterium]|nr:hypothetical protein [Chlamydiales bacterium]
MSVRPLYTLQFLEIRQAPQVPTISKESRDLLSNEVFSKQSYWVKRAFTEACSISDKAKNIQDLTKTVPAFGNDVVNNTTPAILIAAGIVVCLAGAVFTAYLLTLSLVKSAVFACIAGALIGGGVIGKGQDAWQLNNSMYLTNEWENITHQKESWNNICMGVIDLPSYINEEPSLMQAKREFAQVYQWIRE